MSKLHLELFNSRSKVENNITTIILLKMQENKKTKILKLTLPQNSNTAL